MLFKPLLGLLAALPLLAVAKDVDVSVKFPDSNPFGKVINGGSSNLLQVRLANHAGEQLTVSRIFGSYSELSGKRRQLRNTTTLQLKQTVNSGLASPVIPYKFHCENKIGEVGLKVWVDYLDSGNKVHTVLGYDGPVTVVEPESTWFDPQLILLYLLLAAFFSFIFRQIYSSYTSSPAASKKKFVKKTIAPVEKEEVVVREDGKNYDEGWIPEAHKRVKKSVTGEGATSGEESEGRGTPRRRKGKK